MAQVTVKELLEAGVHFGHQTKRWNPKMKRYIFGERDKIYIIDLEKTLACIQEACSFLNSVAERGGTVLFVGTKKQGQASIEEAAKRCSMPYVTVRWLGGMLTNFDTIKKSVARLELIEKMEQEGTYHFITKKEVAHLRIEREKLNKVLYGIREMKRLPEAVFIIDPRKEEIAVHEAARLGIPSVALIDTNSDPDRITYPIPGNDDAIRSIRLISEIVANVVSEARARYFNYKKAAEDAKRAEEAAQASPPSEAPEALPAGGEASVPQEGAKEVLSEPEVPLPVPAEKVERLARLTKEDKAKVKGRPKKTGKTKE